MFEQLPEEFLHEGGVALLVGVGKTIAGWRAQTVAH
jgi:hypothetical protein